MSESEDKRCSLYLEMMELGEDVILTSALSIILATRPQKDSGRVDIGEERYDSPKVFNFSEEPAIHKGTNGLRSDSME